MKIKTTNEISRFNSSMAAMRRRNLNGIYDPHTNQMQYPRTMQPTHARWEPVNADADAMDATTIPASIVSHYLIADTLLQNPPYSNLGIPGPDGAHMDIGFNGVSSIPKELRDELPEECRRALESVVRKEEAWKESWGDEERNARRRAPVIDKGVV